MKKFRNFFILFLVLIGVAYLMIRFINGGSTDIYCKDYNIRMIIIKPITEEPSENFINICQMFYSCDDSIAYYPSNESSLIYLGGDKSIEQKITTFSKPLEKKEKKRIIEKELIPQSIYNFKKIRLLDKNFINKNDSILTGKIKSYIISNFNTDDIYIYSSNKKLKNYPIPNKCFIFYNIDSLLKQRNTMLCSNPDMDFVVLFEPPFPKLSNKDTIIFDFKISPDPATNKITITANKSLENASINYSKNGDMLINNNAKNISITSDTTIVIDISSIPEGKQSVNIKRGKEDATHPFNKKAAIDNSTVATKPITTTNQTDSIQFYKKIFADDKKRINLLEDSIKKLGDKGIDMQKNIYGLKLKISIIETAINNPQELTPKKINNIASQIREVHDELNKLVPEISITGETKVITVIINDTIQVPNYKQSGEQNYQKAKDDEATLRKQPDSYFIKLIKNKTKKDFAISVLASYNQALNDFKLAHDLDTVDVQMAIDKLKTDFPMYFTK